MFDAVFALRAAVEAAIKSLGAMTRTAELQENESAAETEDIAASNQDAEQATQASEASQVAGSDQAASAEGQLDETIMEASNSGNHELAASSSQEQEPIIDDNILRIFREAIAPIVDRIDELMRRVEAVEGAVKTRRRVSSFVASSSRKDENDDDLWRRWVKASESERRMLLREAQKLLAAPIPFDRD
jgi:hypothetical protein